MEKTLVKALKLLEALGRSDEPTGVTALAGQLKLTKSNVHRLLDTLVRQGYVRRHDDVGRYDLTLKLWQIGTTVRDRLDVGRIASPHLRALMEATGEAANLSVLDEGNVVYVSRIECRQPIRAHFPIGASLPAYCTSTGKAILAFQSEETVRASCGHIAQHTARTVSDYEALVQELARVRRNGYAVNHGEWRESVCGVAAPVRDAMGRVEAAVAVSGPAERFRGEAIRRFSRDVVECSRRVSADLGYDLEAPLRSAREWKLNS